MILRYRVSLAGLKGFARVYDVESHMTLYKFHKLLNSELEFSHDQLIQFKALDASGNLVARYALFDLGYGAVDDVTFADTVGKEVASFIYFYDVPNRKSVIVTFEGEADEEKGRVYPYLVETKGPNPIEFENGYVAYEDRPAENKPVEKSWSKDGMDFDSDDEEEADLEEEDEEEDGKEIYDESEDIF